MATDRARVSYDPTKGYRSVVMQQGRVTLEADVNEAQTISSEMLREETLDIVGPAGTPDNGYEIGGKTATAKSFDFHIGSGVMYVGGERVSHRAFDYSTQPEWLDRRIDPLWVDTASVSGQPELIELFLREQEVTAVEDTTLREVALGGPDTAGRTRVVQRIVRVPVKENTCAAAEKDVDANFWPDHGVKFNPFTMRLNSPATLQVQLEKQQPPASNCDPQVPGGYLGADNQLIRVQITEFDLKTNQGKFVWGYNDASFLYRVTAPDSQTLQLQSAPIDSYHTPVQNQAVEILATAVPLGKTDYIASPTGIVQTLTKSYAPETGRVPLPNPLPAAYTDTTQTPQLFLRLWQEEVSFTSGAAANLAGTGLQVVIDAGAHTGSLTIGQYWMFAVRPSTPQQIYPQRYLDGPQPPEGPRMWVCPLAVIGWQVSSTGMLFELLDDCRLKFDNLVELTKRPHGECCSIVLTQAEVDKAGGLQAVLDAHKGPNTTISLQPGAYTLTRPLRLGAGHSGLTLEGCRDGVILSVATGSAGQFLDGMVVLNQVNEITLRRISFNLPLASFTKAGGVLAGLGNSQLQHLNALDGSTLFAGIGIRALDCSDLRILGCDFHFQAPPPPLPTLIFEAGLFATAGCDNLEISNCVFDHLTSHPEEKNADSFRIGVMIAPATSIGRLAAGAQGFDVIADVLPASSLKLDIVGNLFSGLAAAALVYADLSAVRLEGNTTGDCYAGFWFSSLKGLAPTSPNSSKPKGGLIHEDPAVDLLLTDPVMAVPFVIARGYPLPPEFKAASAGSKHIEITMAWQPIPPKPPTNIPEIDRGFVLNSLLVVVEQTVFAGMGRTAALALLASGNQLEVVRNPPFDGLVGVRLLVIDDVQDTGSAVIIGANYIRNLSLKYPLPTVGVILAARCSVTGNLILDEGSAKQKKSLYIVTPGAASGVDPIAVTGNVFRGEVEIPSLARWAGFNSILPS